VLKPFFAVLSSVLVSCGPSVVEPCPVGWISQSSGAQCSAPPSVDAAFRAQLGNGLYGYVRETHLVTSASGSHVTSTLMVGVQVQIVVDTGLPPSLGTCAFSPNPIATTITDSQGIYALPAAPGQWRLESCTASGTLTVPFNNVVERDIDVNDVPK
jgi:hypothetical protein